MKKINEKNRPAIKVLLIVATAICVAVIGVAGYAHAKLSQMQKDVVQITSKPTENVVSTPIPTPSLEPIEGTPDDIDQDHDDEVDPADINENPIYDTDTIDENVINILIVGEDTRPNEIGRGRSDTLMLLSYDHEANEAKLVSFLRDTYVYIPGHEKWNRINTAYRFGGIGLTINTINENFGLDIQYYIITDFVNMQKIVDTLGGLELQVTQEEAAYINKCVQSNTLPEEKGTYMLTGEQVLAHCRNRKMGDGDWGRTSRQRQVMLAFFNRAKEERSVETLTLLANSLLEYVSTNIDATTLIKLGIDAVFSDNFDLQGRAVPFEDTWKYARVNGASVIQIDLEANKKLLQEYLFDNE